MKKRKLPIGIQTFREVGGGGYYYVFKVVELVGGRSAMAQLKAKGYAEKYRPFGEPVHLIGVEFSKATRNVVAFEVEPG